MTKLDSTSLREKRDHRVLVYIKKLIEIINWNLSEHGPEKLNGPIGEVENISLFILYDSYKTNECLKLKQRLESMGNDVCMRCSDDEYSLESTLNSVDKCGCMLMCITEKYRQSNFCRLITEHAFSREKRMVPLIMQESYENPTGWLRTIMNKENKDLINFTKFTFDECLSQLTDILMSE